MRCVSRDCPVQGPLWHLPPERSRGGKKFPLVLQIGAKKSISVLENSLCSYVMYLRKKENYPFIFINFVLSIIKNYNHILIYQKVYYKVFHKCVYLYGYKISKEWVWFLLKKKIKNLNYIFSTGMYSAFKDPHCGFLRLARRGYNIIYI